MVFNIEMGMDQTCKKLYVEGMKLIHPYFYLYLPAILVFTNLQYWTDPEP